jgi:hypothetical protein
MHEDLRRRPLAFPVGDLEQLASIIYWSYSTFEEGAWSWQAYSFLVAYLAIGIQ